MSGRRRPRKKPEEHHVDERWMASYMDMVTVLMCLFIVLYAMSTVDANKFEKLRNSLATGFGTVASETVDTAEGTVVPPEAVDKNLEAFAAVEAAASPAAPEALEAAMKEVDRLRALEAQMKAGLADAGLSENVEFQIDQRGLTVKLVGSQTFFAPDRPELTDRAAQVLRIVSPILGPASMEVMVEGHAANGITAYPSTWELSSARAVNVLRFMVDRGGIAPASIGAVAFGSARQVNDDSTPELMELNRRVDIVIISDQPDVVRALIPEVLKQTRK
ncbi:MULTISPECIES: OmpA/MotB family protein [unclassified Arthrobacter]|uniref:OmpA/MotB family protein n=1 Tax=unclassified Arthrobacter TaxID=235627 RepID=UPI002DFD92CE|nr:MULTISPECIES: flagellar motor protein MotB [unclassified Arthrobacter]MEC5192931.1 chemotaxis protein MotB [Arthrobacter sp. MP_M4]MEC5204460.1 chemotaxis protein MotB [Arthrobacter sp. MP_M7]